jgi:hypothetical protein
VPPESGLTHFKKDGSRLNKPCEQSHGDIAEKARVQGSFARSLGEAGCATPPGGSFKSRICGHSMGNPCLSKTKQPRFLALPELLRAMMPDPIVSRGGAGSDNRRLSLSPSESIRNIWKRGQGVQGFLTIAKAPVLPLDSRQAAIHILEQGRLSEGGDRVCGVGAAAIGAVTMRVETRARPPRPAMEILKERFARGEIDRAELEEKRRIIAEPN